MIQLRISGFGFRIDALALLGTMKEEFGGVLK